MSAHDIDLEMVISVPHYRRRVIDLLNENADQPAPQNADNRADGDKILRTGSKLNHR